MFIHIVPLIILKKFLLLSESYEMMNGLKGDGDEVDVVKA